MALGPWSGEDAGVKRVCSLSTVAAVVVAVVLASAALRAESVGAVLVRPELRTEVSIAWPSGEAPREGVAVLVELTIDEQGKVRDVSVLESAGEAFSEAVLAALPGFEFEPAKQDQVAVPVRIRYRVEFETPRELVAAAQMDSGVASEPLTGPEPGAKSEALDAAVRASPSELERDADAAFQVNTEPLSDESYVAVAEVEAPAREVTRHVLRDRELTQIPGTSGDALRAIEILPGVARTSISMAMPLLRGAGWHESRSYIDGATVPLLFHLGGVKSAFNSHLLSAVELYPSNPRSAYGRGVGGVVAAEVRAPRSDRAHLLGEVSVLDSMLLAETPLSPNAAVAVAVRRSNIDWFYDAVAPKGDFSVVALPVYYDYQGVGALRLSPRHELGLLVYGSRDSLGLEFSQPSDFDPALRDRVEYAIDYHRLQASLRSDLSATVEQRLQLTYGAGSMRQRLGTTRIDLREHDLFSRGEWRLRLGERLVANLGYDLESQLLRGSYLGNRPPQAEGEVQNGSASTEASVDLGRLGSVWLFFPAVYAELELYPTSRLLVVPSVRVDHYSNSEATTVDPRLSCRLELTELLFAKWGLGRTSQNPQYYELLEGLGNPRLEPYHALFYSAGLEFQPMAALHLGLEGYAKHLTHRVVSTPGGTAPYFRNDGSGRIYGTELSSSYTTEVFSGWLSYSLSRSLRRDRDESERLFEADQTHILSVAGNAALGRGWLVGGRFRLTSGNPYTEVRGAVYDANSDVYQPVNAQPFAARNPTFHQLDVRVEKSQRLGQAQVTVYLELQNAYNARNNQGFEYSYDYARRQSLAGLPLLPNLGVRGEM